MKSVIASAVLLAACLVRADNFMVTVGVGGLIFNPNTVTANAGDTVEFVVSGTHDITEAAFSSPCQYLGGGAFSGVSPTPNFIIQVTDTSSRFFYCSVDDHCIGGMVFALNPTGSETFAAFQSAAEAFTGTPQTPSGGETGGTSGAVPSGGESSSSSSSSSSAAETTTSTPSSSSTETQTSSSSSSSAAETTTSASSAPAETTTSTSSSAAAATTTAASTSMPVQSTSSASALSLSLVHSLLGFALVSAWYLF